MAKRRCEVSRITFFAEMKNGDRYFMNLEGVECDETVGIAWAPLKSGKHPWEELYEGKAALEPSKSKEYLGRAQMIRELPPMPSPKPYLCWPYPGPWSPRKPGLISPLKKIPR